MILLSYPKRVKLIVLFNMIICYDYVIANNARYINLSNYIAKNIELQTISNNIANQNTIGFEEDNVISSTYLKKMPKKQNSNFVAPKSNFLTKEAGGILYTNRDLDVAINGDGYFKILTPKGFRYTLDGNLQLNNEGVIVNKNGYPYLDQDNQPIVTVLGERIYINKMGYVFSGNEEIARLGVFLIADKTRLIKEGNSLYRSQINDTIVEDVTILSGALRKSNVDSYRNMAGMLDVDGSIKATNVLMKDSFNLERKAIEKITK